MSVETGVRRLRDDEMDLYCRHLLRLDEKSRQTRFLHFVDDDNIIAHCKDVSGDGTTILAMFINGEVRGACEISPPPASGPDERELSFTVEPDFQGCGIGTLLATRAMAWLRPVPAVMMTLASNRAMLGLAQRMGATFSYQGDTVDCRVETERREAPRNRLTAADGTAPALAAFTGG